MSERPAGEGDLIAASPPRLLLVEGLPGSGKSTLAQRIARHVGRLDRPVRWWYEEERGHPLHPFDNPEAMQWVVDDLFAGRHARVVGAVLDRWQALAAAVASGDRTVILDGMLFGHLTWSLFPADVPRAEIEAYVLAAASCLHSANPALLYLSQRDTGAALRRICLRRGGDTEAAWIRRATENPYARRRGLVGFDGMVAYWSDFGALADGLFGRLDLPRLAVRAGPGAWAAAESRALHFLDFDSGPDPAPPPVQQAHLARLAGAYRAVDTDRPARCRVSLRRGTLSLDGVPHVWPQTRLLADEPTPTPAAFTVESLPFRVRFDEVVHSAGGERWRRMRLCGPELLWGRVGATYRREAGD